LGLLADEVVKLKESGYNTKYYYKNNKELKKVIDMISADYFSKQEPGIFKPIIDSLMGSDYYCLFADYQSYIDKQEEVSKLYLDEDEWTKKSIYNVARIGKFSSDRSVKEYAENIWKVKPVPIKQS